MLRFYSAGSRSPFARSRDVGAVIGRGGNAELVCAAMRFCCGVLHLVHVRYTVLLWRFVFDHACCLPPVRQTGRLAGCCVSIPPGRDRHSRVLVMLARLSAFVGSLRVWTFFYGDLDGIAGDTGDAGNGATGGWRRGLYALLRNHIGFAVLSAGSTLGLNVEAALRPPQTAPKSLRLSGLSSRCGGVVLVQILIPAKSASAPISAPTRAKPGYMERPVRL